MMIIEALTKRRNEITAEIRTMQQSITNIDATIKLFQGDYTAPRVKHGNITRAIFDVLRNATEPMTTSDIATAINMEIKPVGAALNVQQKKGLVTSKREGVYSHWEIVR